MTKNPIAELEVAKAIIAIQRAKLRRYEAMIKAQRKLVDLMLRVMESVEELNAEALHGDESV